MSEAKWPNFSELQEERGSFLSEALRRMRELADDLGNKTNHKVSGMVADSPLRNGGGVQYRFLFMAKNHAESEKWLFTFEKTDKQGLSLFLRGSGLYTLPSITDNWLASNEVEVKSLEQFNEFLDKIVESKKVRELVLDMMSSVDKTPVDRRTPVTRG